MVPRAGSIIWNCSELQVGEWMAWWGVTKGTNRDHHGFWGLVCLRFWCLRSKWALLCLKTALWGWEEGAGGWFPACAARRHLRLSPALETRSCWAEHPWIAWTTWDGDPVFSLAQDHDTAFCLQLQTDFWQIEGFFLPSSVCWDPHAECSAGIFGCTQPWGCAYKRFLKPSGKKKIFVCRACLLSIQTSHGSISSFSFSKGSSHQEQERAQKDPKHAPRLYEDVQSMRRDKHGNREDKFLLGWMRSFGILQ